MARALDEQKRREWVKRFERFRASGATVARFCGHERVSVNTFYYWSKRVRSAAALERRDAASEEVARSTTSIRAKTRDVADERSDPKAAAQALVRFRFGSVEVDVPAGCLEVIRCLAESAARSASPATPSAFHEVVIGARR